jgi:hypothetical protein
MKIKKKQFRKLKNVTTRPRQNKYCPAFSYEAQCEITMLNEATQENKWVVASAHLRKQGAFSFEGPLEETKEHLELTVVT